jgi:ethanolamine utilization protein EutA
MHDLDIFHEHLTMSDEDRAEIAQYIWNQENVELSTIGIDIGSSTSHLLFAKVLLQRQTQGCRAGSSSCIARWCGARRSC